MRLKSAFLSGLAPGALFFSSFAVAAPASLPVSASASPQTIALQQDQTSQQQQSCNTPSNRACWLPGFDINTDWEVNAPTTGVVRSYTFVLTEVDNYIGGDGVAKNKAMLINGQFPGPTVEANWGDTISVNVVNKLRTNGTGIHWHGIRQLNNNINDGVPGVTECPIPPGHNKTYTFTAMQYGTSWYHTHVSSQYAYGVTGSIQINGPASLNYDVDLGPFPISDWYYGSADELLYRVSDASHPFVPGRPGASPPSDNLLFNGTNINPRAGSGGSGGGGGGGAYATVNLTPGKRHRLRLINPSVDNTFTVSIVNHQMTVIATDFVPVDAYTTSSLFLGVGQRYDVILDASQGIDNYWINATYSATHACGSSNNPYPAAILHYDGAPVYTGGSGSGPGSYNPPGYNTDAADANDSNGTAAAVGPSNSTNVAGPGSNSTDSNNNGNHHRGGGGGGGGSGGNYNHNQGLPTNPGTPPPDTFCADNTQFVPVVPRVAPLDQFNPVAGDTLPVSLQTVGSRVFWQVNGSAIDVAWDKPTLQYLLEEGGNGYAGGGSGANNNNINGSDSDNHRGGGGGNSGLPNFPASANIIELPETGSQWSFWLIQNVSPVPHPMHLHGHDFLILGQSPAPSNPLGPANAGPVQFNMIDRSMLRTNNPVRRDATMLPSFGWLLVAFEATNPGAWVFHCHIAWHASEGLSAQFLEQPSKIRQAMDLNAVSGNCANWRTYEPTDPFQQTDSGI
ncbi:laccase [Niveomyces insectorum RCEF 264]|uniref:laccase n=1 Tax=Niveomyces insectorum RCEF 264 TaxID=1081102 RepID=A0A167XWI9_9HYPO|nr:laccase [Niveomyces insectorum RCEF 264]